MCLTEITKAYKRPERYRQPRIGYKIFRKRNKCLYPYIICTKKRVKTNKWLYSEMFSRPYWILSTYEGSYRAGFHIFTSIQDAKDKLYVGGRKLYY